MRFLLLIGLILSNACFGSVVDERQEVVSESRDPFVYFEEYKKAFALYFCTKAAEQKKPEIADRCGRYAFGKDWQEVIKVREIPHIPKPTDYDLAVASAVAHDMVHHLDDIADWLKQNAQ